MLYAVDMAVLLAYLRTISDPFSANMVQNLSFWSSATYTALFPTSKSKIQG